MAEQSVLVVEDTDEIRELVVTVLRRAGFDVREASSGAAVPGGGPADAPDLIVLDLGLPDADGTEVCRQIRAETQCYVLMLTARAEEVDLLIGLAVGADGYMAKPFSPRELVARVQAMLRFPRQAPAAEPAAQAEESVRRLAELEVDEESREVRVDGAVVDLTRTEFDLLAALASRPGRVLQRETLLREVWQTDWEGNLRLVEAHMSNLRRKLRRGGAELAGDPHRARRRLPARRRLTSHDAREPRDRRSRGSLVFARGQQVDEGRQRGRRGPAVGGLRRHREARLVGEGIGVLDGGGRRPRRRDHREDRAVDAEVRVHHVAGHAGGRAGRPGDSHVQVRVLA